VARRVRITVEPSEDHPDVLSVQDALQQAIDFFDLLTDEANAEVVWNLTLASTNSPFTCEGEPVNLKTMAGAHAIVEGRVAIVERNFARVARGEDFDEGFPKERIDLARRILKRTANGIGATLARFSEDAPPVEITHEIADRYFREVVAPEESLHSYLFSRTARKEIGSIEGRLLEIGTDYDSPAIHVAEHKSGRKVWCRISRTMFDEIADQIKAKDAWDRRRVRVRGTLNYDNDGKTIRVIDGTVAFIETQEVDISRLADRTFTEGYSVQEYLDRLRENEFGH
jgi:hypothetical protein